MPDEGRTCASLRAIARPIWEQPAPVTMAPCPSSLLHLQCITAAILQAACYRSGKDTAPGAVETIEEHRHTFCPLHVYPVSLPSTGYPNCYCLVFCCGLLRLLTVRGSAGLPYSLLLPCLRYQWQACMAFAEGNP